MNIYTCNDRTPYTYEVIFHQPDHKYDGMKYIGAKWAKHCSPTTFWIDYFTTSKIIRELVKIYGSQSFEVKIIKSNYVSVLECAEHETSMLKEVNAKYNPKYFNQHNGDGKLIYKIMTTQTKEKRKETMLRDYGVTNPSYVISSKLKRKKTWQIKYGTDHPFKSQKVKEKILNHYIEKYGVENPQQLLSVKNKTKETCLRIYGVDHPCKNSNIREKYKQQCMEKYGTDNVSKNEEIKRKKLETKRRKNKKVICINDHKIFDLLIDAAQYYNISKQGISAVICGRQKSCAGYKFEYVLREN